jgi:hypothetical protein
MTLRQRSRGTANAHSDESASTDATLLSTVQPKDPLLDELEQERYIMELRAQSANQERQISRAFQGLCLAVAVTMALFAYWENVTAALVMNSSKSDLTWWNIWHYGHVVSAMVLLEVSCRILSTPVLVEDEGDPTTAAPHPLTSATTPSSAPPIHKPRSLPPMGMITSLEQVCLQFVVTLVAAGGCWWFAHAAMDAAAMNATEQEAWQRAVNVHYGILAGNTAILAAALLIRYDHQQTQQALQVLDKARYNYKSL